jgi:hypothetical protein
MTPISKIESDIIGKRAININFICASIDNDQETIEIKSKKFVPHSTRGNPNSQESRKI